MEAIANLSDQGFIQFRTIVFESIMPQVNKAVLGQIRRERNGEQVDTELLRSVLAVYKYLSNDKISGASKIQVPE